MVLRTGKLQRPCKKCGRLFEPTGRSNWICENCSPKTILMKLWEKTQRKRNRAEKLKKRLSEVSKSEDFKALKGKDKK